MSTPGNTPATDRYGAEVAALAQRLARAALPPRPIVIYGSSTVRLWQDPRADLGRDDVLAVGFGGATLPDLERRYDTLVAPLRPRCLLVAAGANDLEQGDVANASANAEAAAPVPVLARLQALVVRARGHDAALPVLLLTLKPAPFHAARMPTILAINAELGRTVAGWPGVRLVDTCTPFLNAHGQADPAFYADDRRHMNARGQALWVSLIAQALP